MELDNNNGTYNTCKDCISQTGGCCVNVRLFLTEEDIIPFTEVIDKGFLPENHTFEIWSDNGLNGEKTYVYNSKREPCVFLQADQTCAIYDNRPGVCRLYPVLWNKDQEDPFSIFIDLLCPLAHTKPLFDIYDYALDPRNIDHMRKIGPLNFDPGDTNSINITDKKRYFDGLKNLYDRKGNPYDDFWIKKFSKSD